MRCLRAIMCYLGGHNTKCQDQRGHLYYHRCHQTEDSGGLGMFAVSKEIDKIVRQAYKQDVKEQLKRGKPLKRWSDQVILGSHYGQQSAMI